MFSLSHPGLAVLRPIGLALGGAALITLGAKMQVPFWPVPMTLHSLAVFFVAGALGPRLGLAAMLAYLGAGVAGIPVFSGSPERGIGLGYMMGPTGGYLLGYLVAVPIAARGSLVAMLAGLAIVYAAGLAWLAAFMPMGKLLAAGFAPFIVGDLIKIALARLGVARLRGRK